jgi:hypothetical protein
MLATQAGRFGAVRAARPLQRFAHPPPPLPIGSRWRRPFSQTPWRRAPEDWDSAGGATGGAGKGEPTLAARMLDSAATTLASVLVLGAGFALAGYVYHKSYKTLQLQKIANAFEPGDPVLDLAAMGKDIPSTPHPDHWIMRAEQAKIDAIINGADKGHYFLIMGEKGCGKSSMLLEAMRKIDGAGCAMFEAHADLEIFRIRLGKALDYEFRKYFFFAPIPKLYGTKVRRGYVTHGLVHGVRNGRHAARLAAALPRQGPGLHGKVTRG